MTYVELYIMTYGELLHFSWFFSEICRHLAAKRNFL